MASTPYIHLIASVDHMAANRLWTNQQLDKFGFYMQRCDTFQPYDNEYTNQGELFSIKNDN